MDIIAKIHEFIKELNANKIEVSNILTYKVAANDIVKILEFLKSDETLRFTILTDLFAADFPDRESRFELVYNLLSLKLNQRIVIKTELKEGQNALSATKIFAASGWYEREAFDMYGIKFDNNPDMRRILTDYGFVGHPLRKDFPLSGHVQVKYDNKLEQVIYEPVKLDQEYRDFDFTSKWQGPGEYKLPGDEKAIKE